MAGAEKEIMTYDEAVYVEINGAYELMNVGFSQFNESLNPIEKSTQYIGDKSKTNKVTGYDTSFAIESELIQNNAVVEYFYDIIRKRKTGADAQQKLCIVELWNGNKARVLNTTAVLNEVTNTAGEIKMFSGDLKGIGDFTYGTFNTSTKEFTPDNA